MEVPIDVTTDENEEANAIIELLRRQRQFVRSESDLLSAVAIARMSTNDARVECHRLVIRCMTLSRCVIFLTIGRAFLVVFWGS